MERSWFLPSDEVQRGLTWSSSRCRSIGKFRASCEASTDRYREGSISALTGSQIARLLPDHRKSGSCGLKVGSGKDVISNEKRSCAY